MGEKAVTIAFFYKGTTTKAGTFEIDNVVVKAVEGTPTGDAGGDDNTGDGSDDSEDNNDNTGNGDDNTTGGNDGNFTSGTFTHVMDASQLTVGDSILIIYENFVMGAHSDTGKYRTKTAVTTTNGVVTSLASDAQIILLEQGVVAGTYAFNVGNGYLAASSSSSNNLATVDAIDANGSWAITISDGLATIVARGDKTRNTLQYNTSSPRFSCYTGSQKSVNIYAKSSVSTGIVEVADENVLNVYSITGVLLRSNVSAGSATNGLHRGIYIIGNRKVFVK